MTVITLVAAVARNGVIGNGEAMPWRLPEDLAHFKNLTMGHPVVMGRRTWDSLPPKFRPLPGRRNLVVTRNAQWHAEGAERAGSLEAALALAGNAKRLFVIGGGELYALALPLADELELTELELPFEGRTVFPPYRHAFEETARETHRAAPPNEFGFAFVSYRRSGAGKAGAPAQAATA